jgi:hypothetical protein
MDTKALDDVYSIYKDLSASVLITRRCIDQDVLSVTANTRFELAKDKNRLPNMEEQLEELVVLSLFASFERNLRDSIETLMRTELQNSNKVVNNLLDNFTYKSMDRWLIKELLDIFKEMVAEETLMQAKQIVNYRNWIAHGKHSLKVPSRVVDADTTYKILSDFLKQTAI